MVKVIIFLYEPDLSSLPSLSLPTHCLNIPSLSLAPIWRGIVTRNCDPRGGGGWLQLLRFVRMGGVAWRCWSCDAITQDPLYVAPLLFLPLCLPSNKHAEWRGGRREDTRSVGLSVYAPRINAFPDATLCREGRPNLYPSAQRIATSGGSVIRLLCPRRSIFLPLGRFTEPNQ